MAEAIYYDNRHWIYINAETWTADAMRDGTMIEYPHQTDALNAHPDAPVVYDDVTGMTPEQFGVAVSSAITAEMKAAKRRANETAAHIYYLMTR